MEPNIFEYTNYRSFIKDYYEYKKSQSASFSYTLFARSAGFKSKASLANITTGIQALSKNRIHDIANAMKLGKNETEFFEALVYFNDAKTVEKRSYYFNLMQKIPQKNSATRLVATQSDYYSEWYHCVIRELVTFIDFKEDYKLLASMTRPPIKPLQAKESVDLLINLGLIERQSSGKYRQTDSMLSSGEEIKSMMLQKYHRQHLAIASDSIDRYHRSIRNISSITAGLSRDGFNLVNQELASFQQRLLKIIESDSTAETVFQIAFQLYPISKAPQHWSNTK